MSRVLPDASAFGAAFELISERFDVTQSARIPTAVFPVTHYTHHDAFFASATKNQQNKIVVFFVRACKKKCKSLLTLQTSTTSTNKLPRVDSRKISSPRTLLITAACQCPSSAMSSSSSYSCTSSS